MVREQWISGNWKLEVGGEAGIGFLGKESCCERKDWGRKRLGSQKSLILRDNHLQFSAFDSHQAALFTVIVLRALFEIIALGEDAWRRHLCSDSSTGWPWAQQSPLIVKIGFCSSTRSVIHRYEAVHDVESFHPLPYKSAA
jgi:hypothetical protein